MSVSVWRSTNSATEAVSSSSCLAGVQLYDRRRRTRLDTPAASCRFSPPTRLAKNSSKLRAVIACPRAPPRPARPGVSPRVARMQGSVTHVDTPQKPRNRRRAGRHWDPTTTREGQVPAGNAARHKVSKQWRREGQGGGGGSRQLERAPGSEGVRTRAGWSPAPWPAPARTRTPARARVTALLRPSQFWSRWNSNRS